MKIATLSTLHVSPEDLSILAGYGQGSRDTTVEPLVATPYRSGVHVSTGFLEGAVDDQDAKLRAAGFGDQTISILKEMHARGASVVTFDDKGPADYTLAPFTDEVMDIHERTTTRVFPVPMLDLSVAHVSQSDQMLLDSIDPMAWTTLHVERYEYGWHLHADVVDARHGSVEHTMEKLFEEGFSPDLIDLLVYANESGIDMIRMDRDGEEMEDLPYHDWEEGTRRMAESSRYVPLRERMPTDDLSSYRERLNGGGAPNLGPDF